MHKKPQKTNFELQKSFLLGCNVCGRNHTTESCSFLRELKPIEDTKTPSRARLTLPANLEVQDLADNSTTVVARAPFVRSVQFGPFVARHTQMLHPAVSFPLKVFGKSEETSYYLDTSDEEACNWMCLVSPATSCKEQNLICYQMGQEIFYTVMRDIQIGEQLRVWYAPYYAVKMGAVPFNVDFTSDVNREKTTDHMYESKQKLKTKEKKNFHGMLLSREVTQKLAEQLPARQLGARRVTDRWTCRLCCAEESSVVLFAKHLMSHYKRTLGQSEKLWKCHLCRQKFESEKMLVKHKVVRHKMVLQRPRLLDNVEDEDSAGVDTSEEASNDVLEENEGRMTSIVIANLTGELPSQFPQPGSQTVFVTNTGQIFTDSENDSDLQERQNEALNVLLEQLQSSDTFKVPQDAGSETGAQENTFPQGSITEKDNELVLHNANVQAQYESVEGNVNEARGPVDILAELKKNTVNSNVTQNSEDDNRGNILNVINTSTTSAQNHNNITVNSIEEGTRVVDSINKCSVQGSIFDTFQSNPVESEEILSTVYPGNGKWKINEQYHINNSEHENSQAGNHIVVSDVINNNIAEHNSVNCIINSTVIETDIASNELRLSDEQDDVSSAFLDLVSAPSFETANDVNKSIENTIGVAKSLPIDISLPNSFNVDSASDETLMPSNAIKISDLGPPYNCDICNKEFHKADYLYRHLRKHTGEFTCVSCLAVFARKESLMNHACFADSSGANDGTCPYCQKKFHVKKLLNRHMARHTGEWKCDICQRLYSSKTTLASHRCIKKPSPIHQCQVCKREFLRRSYLEKHMLLHLESHPCNTCGKKLKSGEILQTHQLYCSRGKLLETIGETSCPHCNVAFSQLIIYRQHVYQHTHPYVCQHCGARFKMDSERISHVCSEDAVKCDICTKQFSSLFTLSRHQIVHGVPQFHCYECAKSFHQCENYTSHSCNTRVDTKDSKRKKKKAVESEIEAYENSLIDGNTEDQSNDREVSQKDSEDTNKSGLVCDVCGEVYKTIHILKAHMNLHGERKFACDICNKKFHRKDVLQEHHSVHQDAKIPCPLCNKKLKTKKSLDVHMHRHTGITRYTCSDCGKKFFQKGNLMKHAAVHNPNAKTILTCDHCNKNFTSRDYLAQHMLEHTQGRIYQCHLCDKGFVKEHMLKGHMKKIHGGHMYVCPFCNMSVHHRNSIRRHLENRHGELHHEWSVPGFLDKLESCGTETPANTLLNASVVSHPCEPNTAILETSQQIDANSGVSLTQTDNQPEGTEVLLTVSGVPLNADSEMQSPEDQTEISNQMELQMETDIQGDEVTVGNTFIFSDGTIIQQEDAASGAEILLYVLDAADVSIDSGY